MLITTFLAARMDEEISVAAAATSGPWSDSLRDGNRHDALVAPLYGGELIGESITAANRAHIAAQNPQKVMVKCRAVLGVISALNNSWANRHVGLLNPATEAIDGLEWACRELAQPYRQHPDYQTEWDVADEADVPEESEESEESEVHWFTGDLVDGKLDPKDAVDRLCEALRLTIEPQLLAGIIASRFSAVQDRDALHNVKTALENVDEESPPADFGGKGDEYRRGYEEGRNIRRRLGSNRANEIGASLMPLSGYWTGYRDGIAGTTNKGVAL